MLFCTGQHIVVRSSITERCFCSFLCWSLPVLIGRICEERNIKEGKIRRLRKVFRVDIYN